MQLVVQIKVLQPFVATVMNHRHKSDGEKCNRPGAAG